MTVFEIIEKLGLEIESTGGDLKRKVSGAYTGDLLSLVMSGLSEGGAWITVQTNINIVAVSALCDAACIIIAEGRKPDDEVCAKAKEQGVTILSSDMTSFELSHKLGAII